LVFFALTALATAVTSSTNAGDSSLDNKYWFHDVLPAPPGYQSILRPPEAKPDVTYWLNTILSEERHRTTLNLKAINTAVEATTLNERTFQLRPQDRFLRDNLQANDILVVSIGGNDVALLPCPCTIASMLCLARCTPQACIENGGTCGTFPCDDYCCGCGPSLWSCFCAYPPCLGYLRHLFGTRVGSYIRALTSKNKPAKILVCMIYYPAETMGHGWAEPALKALGYNSNPDKVQAIIRKMFVEATGNIPGVVPVPLFHALDGKDPADYVARVEPSARGGRKMAEFLLHSILQDGGAPVVADTIHR
jgi:hypothetical protein